MVNLWSAAWPFPPYMGEIDLIIDDTKGVHNLQLQQDDDKHLTQLQPVDDLSERGQWLPRQLASAAAVPYLLIRCGVGEGEQEGEKHSSSCQEWS